MATPTENNHNKHLDLLHEYKIHLVKYVEVLEKMESLDLRFEDEDALVSDLLLRVWPKTKHLREHSLLVGQLSNPSNYRLKFNEPRNFDLYH